MIRAHAKTIIETHGKQWVDFVGDLGDFEFYEVDDIRTWLNQ